ncbi:MAG: ATP-binding protein [Gemmataceae bacterium]
MLRSDFPSWIFRLATLLSLSLLGLCIVGAVYLYRQQADTAESLGENIGSRRVARNLQVDLGTLVDAVRRRPEQVAEVDRKLERLIAQAQDLADKDEERRLVATIEDSYRRFKEHWRRRSAAASDKLAAEALAILETETLPACIQLVNFNADQIEESEARHRATVRHMSFGLFAFGAVGSLLGIVLGYTIARRLRQSLYQMSIVVQDAAGKLAQGGPLVNLVGPGDLNMLREQMKGVVHDIEETVERLQQRERELSRSEQLAKVGQLAASAAHELRNPLTSIKLLIQSNREKAEAAALPVRHLTLIEQEIRRMERYLQMFMDFARPPRPKFRRVSLGDIASQALALLEPRARKQEVRIDYVPPEPPIYLQADGDMLQQIFVNLALNAIEAMTEGGRLEVRMRDATAGWVEVEVLDSGPGLSAEGLQRLFEPFYTTKETGSGLGLVVSRRIAQNHQGMLEAFNRPEGGARFVLRLPVDPPAPAVPSRVTLASA